MDLRLAMAALVALQLLAGCAATAGDLAKASAAAASAAAVANQPFTMTVPKDPRTQPIAFHANVPGDNFTWDFGVGDALANGRDVAHLYGVRDGLFKVRLVLRAGGSTGTYEQALLLGRGSNSAPFGQVHATSNWVEAGTPIGFAATTEDAENDPVLTSWTCRYLGALQPATASNHVHPVYMVHFTSYGGFPFLVDPTTPAEGPNLSSACSMHPTATQANATAVQLATEQTGFYQVAFTARDGAHPPTVGTFNLVIGARGSKPDPHWTASFDGTLAPTLAGPTTPYPGSSMTDPALDVQSKTVNLPLPSSDLRMTVTYDGGPVNNVEAKAQFADGRTLPEGNSFPPSYGPYAQGDVDLYAILHTGTQVPFHIGLQATLTMEPCYLYACPWPSLYYAVAPH